MNKPLNSRRECAELSADGALNASYDLGLGDYERSRIKSAAKYFSPSILDSGLPLSKMTALEIGSGKGLKAAIFGPLFKSYIGVELDPSEADFSRKFLNAAGIQNVDVFNKNGLHAITDPSEVGLSSYPDFLILYAVLEHMLPEERSEALTVARRVVSNGGAVFVAETPNRLIPFDVHSSQLHFTQSLPPELALRYSRRSQHEAWRYFVKTNGDDVTALNRSGLGLSYHDFDLDFGSAEDIPVVFSGWTANLLSHQPLQNDEAWLHQYLDDNEIRVSPLFSRYWLEGLFSYRATKHHSWTTIPNLRAHGGEAIKRRKPWQRDFHIAKAPASVTGTIETPRPADQTEIVIQFEGASSFGVVDILVNETPVSEALLSPPANDETQWHQQRTLSLLTDDHPSIIEVRPKDGAQIVLTSIIVNGYQLNSM